MIGCSVSCSLESPVAPSLLLQIQRIFGASILGYRVARSAVLSGADVSTLPGLVGPTLTNSHATNRFQMGALTGHPAISRATSTNNALVCMHSAPFKSVWAVTLWPPDPIVNYLSLVSSGPTANYPLVEDSGLRRWYGGGGYSAFYANGSAVTTGLWSNMPSGVVIVEATGAAVTDTQYCLMGLIGQNLSWTSPVDLTFELDRQPTAPERAAAVAAIKREYRIP